MSGSRSSSRPRLKSQTDQTNRTQAQQHARLGLDKLRREIRCASALTTPSGYPASAITITLGSYCPTAGGAATTVTWCTKDRNGATPPVAGAQPYTLWRYTGSACSGTGTKWASNLVDKSTHRASPPARSSTPPSFRPRRSPGVGRRDAWPSGTYSYEVTAVLAGGVEVPGTVASITIASGLTKQVTVSWSAYTGATSYNVYGRDGSGLRLLRNVTSGISFVDSGPTRLTAGPVDASQLDDHRLEHVELQRGLRTRSSSRRPASSRAPGTTGRASPAAAAARPESIRRTRRSTARRAGGRPAQSCRCRSRSTRRLQTQASASC